MLRAQFTLGRHHSIPGTTRSVAFNEASLSEWVTKATGTPVLFENDDRHVVATITAVSFAKGHMSVLARWASTRENNAAHAYVTRARQRVRDGHAYAVPALDIRAGDANRVWPLDPDTLAMLWLGLCERPTQPVTVWGEVSSRLV